MTYTQIIYAAAKVAKVSGALLYAICQYESRDFTVDFTEYDNGSPSYSVCQIKEDTARMMGFKGKAEKLRDARVGVKYAALYLARQQDQYGDDWCKLVAAYNAGTYYESKRSPGYPRNLVYVRRVQKNLDEKLKNRLSCKEEE